LPLAAGGTLLAVALSPRIGLVTLGWPASSMAGCAWSSFEAPNGIGRPAPQFNSRGNATVRCRRAIS
jgi:hypothetical protein